MTSNKTQRKKVIHLTFWMLGEGSTNWLVLIAEIFIHEKSPSGSKFEAKFLDLKSNLIGFGLYYLGSKRPRKWRTWWAPWAWSGSGASFVILRATWLGLAFTCAHNSQEHGVHDELPEGGLDLRHPVLRLTLGGPEAAHTPAEPAQ